MKAALAVVLLGIATAAPGHTLLDFSADERERIAAHGPWPPPSEPDMSNRVHGARAAIDLGRRLFFDASLSGDGRRSCASCHVPARAFQDGLAVARQTQGAGPRNTPGLLDTALQRWWGWDGAHDSLWAASLAPLMAPAEMGQTPVRLAAHVRGDRRLAGAYRAAFGHAPQHDDEVVIVDLAKALAAYQATLVSPRTAFDHFRDALQRGDVRAAGRYPLAAQRGLRLFIGEARCSVCHAGPAFTNHEFGDIGVPFFVEGGVDPGRHGGLAKLLSSRMNRLGPHNDAGVADPRAVSTRHVVGQHRNFGEFKVPGLRQLVHTAPYMHNGSLASIEAVVRHYSELDEDRLHADGERILRRLNLTPSQAADMAAFLRSLSTQLPVGPGLPSSSGEASAGTRKRSVAQAPRSTLRQRSLQKGRHGLVGPYSAGLRQLGQATSSGLAARSLTRTTPARSWCQHPRCAAGLRRRVS